jgi:TnpA family transposase
MKTGCLIVNAIVVWNTVYAQLAIDQLRAEGQLINHW